MKTGVVDVIWYAGTWAFAEGMMFRCAVCASVLGGWSGIGEYVAPMHLAVHELPCPACGSRRSDEPEPWPKGKPRPLP